MIRVILVIVASSIAVPQFLSTNVLIAGSASTVRQHGAEFITSVALDYEYARSIRERCLR